MSGHSKWATIKRSKAATDSKRGKIFTKLGHEIAIAAREGGADPDANTRLRLILEKARQANMPKENIDRAIKRASGQAGDGAELEEVLYEGYGPHGIAIIVQTLTDNKNRTVSEVRHAFSRAGGNLGANGSVAWMFDRKGYILLKPGKSDPEEVALEAIEAGADDIEVGDDTVEVYTQLESFARVRDAMIGSYEMENAQLSWIPQTTTALDEKQTLQVMKLLEMLEDLDDVQEVYSNLDIQDDLIAKFEAEAA
jgi:YebC/PmpR family DNA-binding regulatory protein